MMTLRGLHIAAGPGSGAAATPGEGHHEALDELVGAPATGDPRVLYVHRSPRHDLLTPQQAGWGLASVQGDHPGDGCSIDRMNRGRMRDMTGFAY